ncbi:MAG: 2-dehydropantoate 2-reductase N-terminal domain-containing protein [Bullifex sp.]|nr:2-dehydropantoate 2-reductase N-terminal domain-containing protein [Bullifex sp.]
MRILIYGAGVLGCSLASGLFQKGKDVTLLARGDWASTINEHGFIMKDILRLRTTVSRIPVINELKEDDRYDVIFVCVRYTQLDSVTASLNANSSPALVFVGNNVRAGHYASLFPGKKVLFAFSVSAGHREKDRVVGINVKKITIGPAASCESLINDIFSGTGYHVVIEPNMEDYLLCHAAFILPAVFACYRSDGDLRKLKKEHAYLNMLTDASREGYRAI